MLFLYILISRGRREERGGRRKDRWREEWELYWRSEEVGGGRRSLATQKYASTKVGFPSDLYYTHPLHATLQVRPQHNRPAVARDILLRLNQLPDVVGDDLAEALQVEMVVTTLEGALALARRRLHAQQRPRNHRDDGHGEPAPRFDEHQGQEEEVDQDENAQVRDVDEGERRGVDALHGARG